MGELLRAGTTAFSEFQKLGMGKPIIHIAHANGFPMACYGELISGLTNHFDVIGKPMLAHDSRFPIKDDWNTSVDEIIDFIETNADEKVIGLGHSFGGTITLKAAVKRPDLFKGIILMDPVLMVGFFPTLITNFLKRIGKIGAITPADKTEGRRRNWPSRVEALTYFESKALFKNFSQESLNLYVEHGLTERSDSFHLQYSVTTEVEVFKSIPTDVDLLAKTTLKIPGFIIRGAKTDVAYRPFVNRVARQHKMKVATVNGGHMFPFEIPTEATEVILNKISSILNSEK
ncbi:MAG: pimeloyl-ACP methyl ester carboxylesterase [Bacteroidia bacterium]